MILKLDKTSIVFFLQLLGEVCSCCSARSNCSRNIYWLINLFTMLFYVMLHLLGPENSAFSSYFHFCNREILQRERNNVLKTWTKLLLDKVNVTLQCCLRAVWYVLDTCPSFMGFFDKLVSLVSFNFLFIFFLLQAYLFQQFWKGGKKITGRTLSSYTQSEQLSRLSRQLLLSAVNLHMQITFWLTY